MYIVCIISTSASNSLIARKTKLGNMLITQFSDINCSKPKMIITTRCSANNVLHIALNKHPYKAYIIRRLVE